MRAPATGLRKDESNRGRKKQMPARQKEVQDTILEKYKKQQVPVNIFLINGIKLLGSIKDFDTYVVILDYKGQEQMVFKHSISTISISTMFRSLRGKRV